MLSEKQCLQVRTLGFLLAILLIVVGTTAAQTNTAFGDGALENNQGSENSAFGFDALFNNTTGVNNTASGFAALLSNTTANNNTATGAFALFNNTGRGNTARWGFSAC
jgi:trimeric autotransporter adhesin